VIFFVYITNITAVLKGIYWVFAVAAAHRPDVKPFYKTSWVLRTTLIPSAFLVTLLYWTLVFNGQTDVVDIQVHGVNSALIILEMMVARYPVFLKHVYMPFLYVAGYAIFNVVYCLLGGRNTKGSPFIYAVLQVRLGSQSGTRCACLT
jgi:hypothetical protein